MGGGGGGGVKKEKKKKLKMLQLVSIIKCTKNKTKKALKKYNETRKYSYGHQQEQTNSLSMQDTANN